MSIIKMLTITGAQLLIITLWGKINVGSVTFELWDGDGADNHMYHQYPKYNLYLTLILSRENPVHAMYPHM